MESVFPKRKKKSITEWPYSFPIKFHPHFHTKSSKNLHGDDLWKKMFILTSWPLSWAQVLSYGNRRLMIQKSPGHQAWNWISIKNIQELEMMAPSDWRRWVDILFQRASTNPWWTLCTWATSNCLPLIQRLFPAHPFHFFYFFRKSGEKWKARSLHFGVGYCLSISTSSFKLFL